MADLLTFVLVGLAPGAIYGLAGVGLVLTYRTSGVFNFAHGAQLTVSAYLFYTLHVQRDVPWPAAAAICILVAGPAMGLLMEQIGRRVSNKPLAAQVAATVGVLLAVQAIAQLTYGLAGINVANFLPAQTVSLFGAYISWSDIITFLFALVATVVLSVFLRTTRLGKSMRAVVDNRDLLELTGTNSSSVQLASWIIGSCLAAASGLLFVPLIPLDPVGLTLLVVSAFGAAAIGRFSNLPMTFVGGLAMGVLASLATRYVTSPSLVGLPAAVPFIVLFVMLIISPRKNLWSGIAVTRVIAKESAPLAGRVILGVLLLTFLLTVPAFAGVHLTDWTLGVAAIVVFLSLDLLTRSSGQVSLCHISFVAIGVVTFCHLTGDHVPWGIALAAAGVLAMPVGALLAIPATRHSGLYLALATLGFGILLQYVFYPQNYFFGAGLTVVLSAPTPDIALFSSAEGYYYLVVILTVAAALLVVAIRKGRLGRLLNVMADSPIAMASNGVTVGMTRTLVFCISAGMAAIGGALSAVALTSADQSTYTPILSLTYFAIICMIPGRAPFNCVLAGLSLYVVPSYISGGNVPVILQLIFGCSAIFATVGPEQTFRLPRRIHDLLVKMGPRTSSRDQQPGLAPPLVAKARPTELAVENLTVKFGGVCALSEVALTARTGMITGLIGPNGAGKTTLFNACTGLVSPRQGEVIFCGENITRLSTAARARRGIGRTFQKMELCSALTVRDNVSIGYEGSLAGSRPLRHVVGRHGESARSREAVDTAIEISGLGAVANTLVGALSTGQRRLVELARCIAGPYEMLLLDEPSSGLDHTETGHFGQTLQRVVRDSGVGILLVEHDMHLVLTVCDLIHVLDFGSLIFTGTPHEVSASSTVRAAYLGEQVVTAAADPPQQITGVVS